MGVKDIFDTAGMRTTAASKVYENRVPDSDAEIVRRLKEAEAPSFLGSKKPYEFACTSSGLVSYFGARIIPEA